MLWGIALILLVVWALGLGTASTLTGAAQVLVTVAAALLLVHVVKRYRRRQRRDGAPARRGTRGYAGAWLRPAHQR